MEKRNIENIGRIAAEISQIVNSKGLGCKDALIVATCFLGTVCHSCAEILGVPFSELINKAKEGLDNLCAHEEGEDNKE